MYNIALAKMIHKLVQIKDKCKRITLRFGRNYPYDFYFGLKEVKNVINVRSFFLPVLYLQLAFVLTSVNAELILPNIFVLFISRPF